MQEKPLGILLKCRSASAGWGWDLRVCISNKRPLMPILQPRVCGWGALTLLRLGRPGSGKGLAGGEERGREKGVTPGIRGPHDCSLLGHSADPPGFSGGVSYRISHPLTGISELMFKHLWVPFQMRRVMPGERKFLPKVSK